MKLLFPLLALLLAAGALAACGGDEASPSAPSRVTTVTADSTVELESDPDGDLAYTTDKFTTTEAAGTVVVNFTNFVPETHDVVVEDAKGKILGRTARINDWRDSELIDGIKPGKYTFFCSVPGHREAGMEGTLTVR